MKTFDELKEQGIGIGMCQKFRDEWTNPNVAELCSYFFRGMDFCIEHDWPSLDDARQLFSPGELAEHGIFIADGEAIGLSDVAALGISDVHVFVLDGGTCDVYARHNSTVHLHLGTNSFCFVTVRDEASVLVENKNFGAILKASYYGGTIQEPHMFDTIHNKINKEG
jgi:hypothetical protein